MDRARKIARSINKLALFVACGRSEPIRTDRQSTANAHHQDDYDRGRQIRKQNRWPPLVVIAVADRTDASGAQQVAAVLGHCSIFLPPRPVMSVVYEPVAVRTKDDD